MATLSSKLSLPDSGFTTAKLATLPSAVAYMLCANQTLAY